MPPEEFFRGTTHAGRTLVLYYEHTAFDTFVDETGETFDNPSETKITGTLDGAPIDVQAVNWSGDTATVRSDDLGTFTATNTDYAQDHSEALRRYLGHRPCEGYEVAIVDKGHLGTEASYTVTVTNGRLTERVEFRLSSRVSARSRAARTRRPMSRCDTRSRNRSGGTRGRRSRSAPIARRRSRGSPTRASRSRARLRGSYHDTEVAWWIGITSALDPPTMRRSRP